MKNNIQKLQQLGSSLLHVLENISDGFYIVNRNWEIIFASHKAEALVNLSKEDIGKVLWERFPDAINSRFYQECHRAFAENTAVSFEAFSPRVHIWCQINAYPLDNHLYVYIKDITEHIQQEKRLQFIANATSEVIWEMALPAGRFTINRARFQQLFGHSLGADQSHPISVWSDKVHPEDRQRALDNLSKALAQGQDFYTNEYRFLKADGSWAYVKNRAYVVKDEFNRPVSLIGAMEDISRERLAEQALQESERSYRQLFQNSPFPALVYDASTLRFLDVNHAAVEHYGYSRVEFLTMTLFDIRPRSEYPQMLEAFAKVRVNTRSDVGTFTHLKKNGELLTVEVSVSTTNFRGNTAAMAIIRDVTDKVRLQQQLLQAEISQQKSITQAVIEAQEQQRSEIGKELHDNINQLLTAAKLYVENIAIFPEHHEMFIQKSCGLLQKTITEIRSLSKQLASPSFFDMGFQDSLLELIEYYNEANLFTIDFIYQFTEEKIDKGLQLTIYRIVQELLTNTVKYAKASKVTIHLHQQQESLFLAYTDNGSGFDPAITKKGLGLKNIKNRAEAYMGKVFLVSSLGNGFSMEICFPFESTNK